MQSAIMSPPLKRSKFSEAEDEEFVDRISSLPDDLLGYMLSFLPTELAVSTSTLSSRWRCLHMLTNCLSFDAGPYFTGMMGKARRKSFKSFVYRVLSCHKVSPIKKFLLDCTNNIFDDSQLHAWISAGIWKGVEQVHLYFHAQLNALPHCLFSCQTLVELKLVCYIDGFRAPNSAKLPRLKILHLRNITFLDSVSFGKLFYACPLLQELEIVHCNWSVDSDRLVHLSLGELKHLAITYCEGRVKIDAPSLAYLKYYSFHGVGLALSMKNPDWLVTAHLELSFVDSSDSIQLALALIKSVYHVRDLALLRDAVKYLCSFEDDQILSYPNLVKLELGNCSYDTWKYVTCLLSNSPRLETLIFSEKLIRARSREEKWPANVVLVVRFVSRVKVIEVFNFRGFTTELVLLKYLLKNAKVLKKLILYKDRYDMTKQQELQASAKLLMLPRTSRNCVVQLM